MSSSNKTPVCLPRLCVLCATKSKVSFITSTASSIPPIRARKAPESRSRSFRLRDSSRSLCSDRASCSASCGGGGPVDILSFTAAEAGTYAFYFVATSDEPTGVDPLLYARRYCALDHPDSELACSDDWNGLLSGIEVELEANEEIFLYVDSYNGGAPGEYQLVGTQGPLMSLEEE